MVDDKDERGRMKDEKKWETISREKFFIEPITERDLVSGFFVLCLLTMLDDMTLEEGRKWVRHPFGDCPHPFCVGH